MPTEYRTIRPYDHADCQDIEANGNVADAWKLHDFKRHLTRFRTDGYAAIVDGNVVGFVVYDYEADALRIIRLSVDPNWRRMRIGSALIQCVKARCPEDANRRKAYAKVIVTIPETDRDAASFLRTQGGQARLIRAKDEEPDEYEFTFTV